MDLAVLQETFPPVLRDSGVDVQALHQTFCAEKPVAIPASQRLEEIFSPIYSAPSVQQKAYLYLKMQELLLYLSRLQPQKDLLPPCESQQTEMIKEIHRELTTHLEQRLTIEDLARKYLMNTSTLKEVFKAVYGQPIGTYMKGYRVEYAMKLLRETRMSIQEIAERVGYRTQGKFSKAFKDVTQMLPTEYRNQFLTIGCLPQSVGLMEDREQES
ncbi:helix-turn-helix domain-containing protein [Gemmiger formicilis]|uniref:helix-turn-helix domain-containing protein n=1 Tax=Gemmiger formicilis TaxID=745368 RepID=UPI001FAF9C90|nr:AraC family transcriptional regulator [Gemmiger formicilis]